MNTILFNMEWNENLPEFCPEQGTHIPHHEVYYRIVKTIPPTPSDFISQRGLKPTKVFTPPVTECRALSLSLFSDLNDAKKKLKLPTFKGRCSIAKVVLNENDGLVKKTAKASHYSWWMTKQYNPEQAKKVDL